MYPSIEFSVWDDICWNPRNVQGRGSSDVIVQVSNPLSALSHTSAAKESEPQ